MKQFSDGKRAWLYGVTGAGVVTLAILGVILRATGHKVALEEPPPPPNHDWFMVATNAMTIDGFFNEFTNRELRDPVSPEEVQTIKGGLYWRVDPSDLINPYTNQPVRWVTEPSAGDYTYIRTSPTSSIMRTYYIDDDNGGQVTAWDTVGTPEMFQAMLALGNPVTDYTGVDWQAANVNKHQWQHLAYLTLQQMKVNDYWPPRTYEQLIEWCPPLAKFKNPYGGYVRNVPADQPSEGNFTFIVQTDANGHVTGYEVDWHYIHGGQWGIVNHMPFEGWQPSP